MSNFIALALSQKKKMDDAAIALLERGEDAMALLRAQSPTPAALSARIARLRATMLARLPVPPCEVLAPYAHEVGDFFRLSLAERVRVQREHRSTPTWSADAEAALARLQLVPPNVAALRLSPPELVSLKRKRDELLVQKQETLLHVHGASEWLHHVVWLASTSTVEMPFPRLALPLLLLSGRRTSEILNGSSCFLPLRRTTCLFSGQLKKRGASAPYEIPLLCDYAVFAHGLAVLRAKQGGVQLTPAAVNARYSTSLNLVVPQLLAPVAHAHQLRAVYAAYAFQLYTSDVTFNRAAMRILGHDKLDVSLSYNAVVLHGVESAGTFGPLP